MYADTAAIRQLAGQLRARAASLRSDADELDRGASAVLWTGRAADAMRRSARDRARGLWSCAAGHDAAAAALDRHAREVDRVQGLASALGQGAGRLLHAATGGMTDVLGDL